MSFFLRGDDYRHRRDDLHARAIQRQIPEVVAIPIKAHFEHLRARQLDAIELVAVCIENTDILGILLW